MTQRSPQQRVWVCGRTAPAIDHAPLLRPSTYPRPAIVVNGGMLISSRCPMTKS